ncbi:MAG: ACT domain-containing protein [Candidatus Verstraetearchaeota archaeon]|nr:ACT domain-containing protein [Candidatus Verstraetearchaeota archaeon]
MNQRYLVIIVVGPDRPGLISEITSVIADFEHNIEEMDQVVMKGIFVLTLLVNIKDTGSLESLRKKLSYRCNELGLEVTFYYAGAK